MINEGISDLKRYRQDNLANGQPATIVEPTDEKWTTRTIKTMDIHVGDIIRVQDNEVIPADCILLSTDPFRKDQKG